MPTGFGSSIEALHDDLQSSNEITDISASLAVLQNGIEYSFVEVTCKEGSLCGLQAYGNETLELHRAAFQEQLKITR
jgi:hypothetical protein